MDKASAARALGMNDYEIVGTVDVDAGTVVKTIDGTLSLVVDGRAVGYYGNPVPNYSGSVPVHPASEEDVAKVNDAIGDAPREELHDFVAAQNTPVNRGLAQIQQDEAGTMALVDDAGPDFDRSEANADTGARNLTAQGNSADPGTVVPDGSVKDVKEWVGADAARAQQALDFENSKDNPRSSLVDHLEKVAGATSRATD